MKLTMEDPQSDIVIARNDDELMIRAHSPA